MPNFKADKQKLEQTMALFDNDRQLPGCDSELLSKPSSAYDHFLVMMLLEHLCSQYTTDPAQKKHFLQLLLENLYKDKLIKSKALTSKWVEGQMEMLKKSFSGWFGEYMQRVFTSMVDPRNNTIASRVSSRISMKSFPNTYEQNFEEVGVIGSGGFGFVYKAVHKIDKLTYAVKKILYSLNHEERSKKVMSEVHSIAALSHPNVVSYKNCWIELLNGDYIEDEGSQSASFASTDFSCSTPGSTSLLKEGSNDSSQQLTPHFSPCVEEKGFFAPTIEEVLSSDSTSFEDADALVNELEELSSMEYPGDSHSDSLVLFDRGNQSNLSSTSTVTFLSEETPGSAIVTRSSSSSEGSHRRERLMAMLCIQMEYCDWDLSKWLEDRMEGKELPFQKEVGDIFRDIVQGVVHIHANGITHRDLKPSNIFYSKRDDAMKIGDFGLAMLCSAVAPQARTTGPRPHTSNLGTLPYMAPEQRYSTDYDGKVDVYSLGIILFELLVPFKTRFEFIRTLDSVLRGNPLPTVITNDFPGYVDLLKNLLQTDPTLRMSSQEILKHPMVAEVKNQELLEIQSLKMTLKLKDLELQEARREISELKAQIQQLNSTSR